MQSKTALEVGVRVAENADSLLARRVELLERHFLDLEVLLERCRQGLLLRGVAEVGEKAVVAEDGEARILERDQRHERVAVLAVAADLVGVGAGGLVAVVAVGDQELGVERARPGQPRSPRGRRCARGG